MRSKTRAWLSIVFLFMSAATSFGADLSDAPSQIVAPPPQATLRQALIERAILYDIRATFDVMDEATIEPTLRSDARRLASTSYLADERSFTQQDLVAEGSYYIVSLNYLVLAGGADWPSDRAASVYEKDAEVKLESLKQRWIASLEVGDTDGLLDIMRDTDTINAWTEGEPALTKQLSHFDNVEELVAGILGVTP